MDRDHSCATEPLSCLLWFSVSLFKKCYKVHILILKINSVPIDLYRYLPLRSLKSFKLSWKSFFLLSIPLCGLFLSFPLRRTHANKHTDEKKKVTREEGECKGGTFFNGQKRRVQREWHMAFVSVPSSAIAEVWAKSLGHAGTELCLVDAFDQRQPAHVQLKGSWCLVWFWGKWDLKKILLEQ